MPMQTPRSIVDFLQQHSSKTQNISAPAGTRICGQGDQCSSLIILTQGVGEISTTHQQVAEELGSSREVISRLLKDMENSGLVSLSRGRIAITDQQGLTALTEAQ